MNATPALRGNGPAATRGTALRSRAVGGEGLRP
jgi:hypothetical protein